MNINLIINRMSNMGSRTSVLSETSQNVKSLLDSDESDNPGFLNGFEVGDLMKAFSEVKTGYDTNSQNAINLSERVLDLTPQVVVSHDDDPFI